MARNTVVVEGVTGRDKGKRYVITEMSAFAIEDWSSRAVLALLKANPAVPEDFATLGTAAMVQMGFTALTKLEHSAAKPLLTEMMDSVQIMPDRSKPQVRRDINPAADDIEEVATIKDLRLAWWKLHMGFFMDAIPSLVSSAKALASKSK